METSKKFDKFLNVLADIILYIVAGGILLYLLYLGFGYEIAKYNFFMNN